MNATASFTHDAYRYETDDDAKARVVSTVERCVDAGGHALVCLPDRLLGPLEPELRHLGPSVTVRAVTDGYRRPVDAMEQLWTFVHSRLAADATHVVSIGELPPPTDDHVDTWVWYEAAVNAVLHPFPVHATCLLDTRRLHPDHCDRFVAAHHDDAAPPMPTVPLPAVDPTHSIIAEDSRSARALVRQLPASFGPTIADAAQLVTSELVTNAIRHAKAPAEVSVWASDDLVIRVLDRGAGLHDVAAGLRPPSLPERGAGLWLCHQLSDAFSVSSRTGGGCDARVRFDAR